MNTLNARREYREAAVRGASQIELVVMMYDMIIEDLDRAIEAINKNDIETRSSEVRHAFEVLENLQESLNFSDGGEAAVLMNRLYSIARARVLEGCIKNSCESLQEQVRIFSTLKSAWQESESASRHHDTFDPSEAPLPAIGGPDNPVACNWSA